MEFIIAKMLLPIMLPILLAAVKVAIDKMAPGLYQKIPKQVWMALIPVLAESAAQYSPELFLFPGLPAWSSTALYTVGSAGAREFLTQIVKMANGDTAPSQPAFSTIGSPSGM